jgi:hypothetical protein
MGFGFFRVPEIINDFGPSAVQCYHSSSLLFGAGRREGKIGDIEIVVELEASSAAPGWWPRDG